MVNETSSAFGEFLFDSVKKKGGGEEDLFFPSFSSTMGLATPPLDYVEKRRNLFPVASGVGIKASTSVMEREESIKDEEKKGRGDAETGRLHDRKNFELRNETWLHKLKQRRVLDLKQV